MTTSADATASHPPRGQHRRRDRRPLRRAGVVALGALLVAGLGGGVARYALDEDSDSGCASTGQLRIAASPEIAPVVEGVVEEAEAQDPCVNLKVDAVTSAATVEAITDGTAPDVWIPDSSTWIDRVREVKGQAWGEGPSIATSPVALAARATAKGAADASRRSWPTIVNGDTPLRMANPDVDTASRLAFHASRVGQPDAMDVPTGKRLIFMSRFAAPSVNALLTTYEGDPAGTDPFPASEQQIAAFTAEHPDEELRAIVPKGGTLDFDYPWLTNPALTPEQRSVTESVRTAFGSSSTRDRLSSAGFRSSDGRGGPRLGGSDPAPVKELTPLDPAERLAAVEQWDTLRTDPKMLALVDVSGSMLQQSTAPGQTRWDVTKGALGKAVGTLPAGSAIGAWAFSSDRVGTDQDWESIAPIERLDAAHGSGSHRDYLTRLIKGSDDLVGGDTGLYDSTWAAYQHLQEDYDGDYINSLVVFTDGENDDPSGGLSLQQLLAKLEAAQDAKRPVRIVTIGMGEADASALRKISKQTGGTSYLAESPRDIERVFVQALLAR